MLRNLFKDAHDFWDEKKIWGAIYLLAAILSIFFARTGSIVLLVELCTGFALFLGVVIGDKVPAINAVPSLGLSDLITNKSNRMDLSRLFGHIFLLIGIIYIFTPIFKANFQVDVGVLAVIVTFGCSLFGVALYGDSILK